MIRNKNLLEFQEVIVLIRLDIDFPPRIFPALQRRRLGRPIVVLQKCSNNGKWN